MVLDQIMDFWNSGSFAPAAIAVGGIVAAAGFTYAALSRDRRIKNRSFKRLYDVLEI